MPRRSNRSDAGFHVKLPSVVILVVEGMGGMGVRLVALMIVLTAGCVAGGAGYPDMGVDAGRAVTDSSVYWSDADAGDTAVTDMATTDSGVLACVECTMVGLDVWSCPVICADGPAGEYVVSCGCGVCVVECEWVGGGWCCPSLCPVGVETVTVGLVCG